jgi:hypothetical protein
MAQGYVQVQVFVLLQQDVIEVKVQPATAGRTGVVEVLHQCARP